MALERRTFEDRESWLAWRINGIGGSEAAAVIGESKWCSTLELWKLKCGIEQPKDLSGVDYVQQGVRMEPVLRDYFRATHPELTIEHHALDVLYQSERPWLFATLDGEIVRSDGQRGILECKYSAPRGKGAWSEWTNRVPQSYYAQVLHQLLATGYSFVYLVACLESFNGDSSFRTYLWERDDETVTGQLAWLEAREREFWSCVTERIMPPVRFAL